MVHPGILVYNGKFKFYTTKFDYHGKGKIIKNYVEFVSSLKNVKMDMKYWPFKKIGKNISPELEKLRVIKSEKEIKKIRKNCSTALKVFDKIKNKLFGMSEIEVAGKLIYEFSKRGYYISFNPIVSTQGDVHHINSNRILKKNDTILLDFGVWNGYSSDNTRMINPDEELSRVISKVFEYVIENAKPGKKIANICRGARKVMGKYNKYFYHALGHGIGISVHELPHVSINSKEKFKEGMVFTIEPGIYMRKKFIRVEDVFVMRKDGVEKLS